MRFSTSLGSVLGRWWVCVLLFAIAIVLFGWIVPAGVADVTAQRTAAPKILDEYIMTWTPQDARHFYEAIGARGRAAYQLYYLHLDFWFPVLSLTAFYMSLLSLGFRPGTRWGWLNLTPLAMYACDAAENLNHFTMARAYPDLSDFSLAFGPWFTFAKWVLIFALPAIAAVGFAGQILGRSGKGRS